MQLALVSGCFALIGALLGTVVAGLFGLRAKQKEYVNDYYKTVMQRRIGAYEQLEIAINSFKTSVVDKDNRPYHLPFTTDKLDAFLPLHSAMSQGLWLSERSFDKLRELNYLLFGSPDTEVNRIKFGKEHYQTIAKIREELERILAADMLELYKVKRFLLQKKRRESGFRAIRLHHNATEKTPKPLTSVEKR